MEETSERAALGGGEEPPPPALVAASGGQEGSTRPEGREQEHQGLTLPVCLQTALHSPMPGISWGADTISAFQKRSGSCVAAVFVAGQLQQEGRRRLSLSRPTGERGRCLLAGLVSAHGGSVITDIGISSTSVFQCLLALTFALCTHAYEVVNPCQPKPTSLFRVLAPSPVPEHLRNLSLTIPEHFPLPTT